MTLEVTSALLRFLAEQLDRPDLRYRSPPMPLTGGHSARSFGFELADPPGRMVLRLIPPTGDASQEIAVHRAVAEAGYPAPAIRWAGLDPGVFGAPYLVMDHVDGRTPLAAAGLRGLPRLFRALPTQLADLMADLHEIPTGGTEVYGGPPSPRWTPSSGRPVGGGPGRRRVPPFGR